jgi:hypothetical protein
MALQEYYPDSRFEVQAFNADVSTAGSGWAVAPGRGKLVKVYTVIGAAITVANAVVTMKIGGTSVTGVSITIAFSGAAAGDVDEGAPTADTYCQPGDKIEFISDGGSTTTSPIQYMAIFERV